VNNLQHANLGIACASFLFGWAAARGGGICSKFILVRKRGFCVFLTQIFSQYLCDHGNKLESYASHNSGHVFHYFFYHFFKNPEGFRPTLHSTFFWDFLRRTRKVERYSDAHPNLGLLGPKKFTFSANISKKFVPKTARKRKFNGKKCPFSCFPPPMVTQTTQHPARWKAHDKTHENYIFFLKKKFKKKTSKRPTV